MIGKKPKCGLPSAKAYRFVNVGFAVLYGFASR